jgi:hypothetical protein
MPLWRHRCGFTHAPIGNFAKFRRGRFNQALSSDASRGALGNVKDLLITLQLRQFNALLTRQKPGGLRYHLP